MCCALRKNTSFVLYMFDPGKVTYRRPMLCLRVVCIHPKKKKGPRHTCTNTTSYRSPVQRPTKTGVLHHQKRVSASRISPVVPCFPWLSPISSAKPAPNFCGSPLPCLTGTRSPPPPCLSVVQGLSSQGLMDVPLPLHSYLGFGGLVFLSW